MSLLKSEKATLMGFSSDKRKRRRQHRTAARNLLKSGGFFNGFSARGSTFYAVAMWHLNQARCLCYGRG